MFPNHYRTLLATIALLSTPVAVCHAQYEDHCGPLCGCENGYQYFEPVDLDLDCLPVRNDCGYMFSYDKLYWSFTGEKTTIGAPGLTYPSEITHRRNPQDEDPALFNQLPLADHPQPYTIINGIQDAPPSEAFGWGDRYEFGYFEDDRAWTVSILDGPDVSNYDVYGFIPLFLGNDGVDIDGDGTIDENQGTGVFGPGPPGASAEPTPLEILLAPTLNGFGSVHVNFEADPGLFLGFRDYWDDFDFDLDADDTLEGGHIVVVGPDGEADLVIDDINGNTGNFLLLLAVDPTDPDNTIVVAVATDFGDLHFFNVRFNTLQVRNRTDASGVELMKTHRLSNRHHLKKNQNSYLEVGYGLRLFRLDDHFRFDGITDIAGRVFTKTRAENTLVGPQFRIKATKQVAKWTHSIDTRFMFGYNITDVDQTNGFGDDAVPGGLNNFLYIQPTFSRYGKADQEFSPFVEFRAETKYQLTKSLALKGGANFTYTNNITRASSVVQYRMPDFGIGATSQQDMFMAGLNFGVEFVH